MIVTIFEYRDGDKNARMSNNFFVPLKEQLPVDFVDVQLPKKRGLDKDYQQILDAFVNQVENLRPKSLKVNSSS